MNPCKHNYYSDSHPNFHTCINLSDKINVLKSQSNAENRLILYYSLRKNKLAWRGSYLYVIYIFISFNVVHIKDVTPPPQEICLLLEINIKHFFFWGGGGVINVFELPKLLNAFFRSVKYINLVLASIYFRSLVIDLISLYWSLAWGGCQSWTETNGHFMGPCFSTRSMYKPFYTHRLSWNKETEKGRGFCTELFYKRRKYNRKARWSIINKQITLCVC